jgi:purine-nucleoside phosphorylase
MKARSSPNRQSSDEFARAEAAAKFIRARTELRPQVALVLGSGLGAFADELESAVRISYSRIPGFPHSTAIGHAGELVIGKSSGIAVAVMQGRVHLYEGYSPAEVVFPVRALGRLGIRAAILTNASGSINPSFNQGSLVILRDHINLLGSNPLTGPNDDRFGPRFPDMTEAYCRSYRCAAIDEAKRLGIDVHEGVYVALPGPSYETPAEIRYLRAIGADLVGMSTVPGVIAARHMGIRVLGISLVTNMAAGILDKPISHDDVLGTGDRVAGQFTALLRALIPRVSADLTA